MTLASLRRSPWAAFALVLLVSCLALAGGALRWWFAPPSLLADDLETLRSSLPSESLVYYADDEEPLGSLFQDSHRVWVEYDDLPQVWVEAVVAIEDARFWSHRGVDPTGVLRAAWRNGRAGAAIEGASTLTMQVVDNLGAGGTDLRGKIREARAAVALERTLSKEDIIEVYSNLFHVRGNGTGIDVAARHYFDKRAGELSVTEAAFIAGTLHAPARYDVFDEDPDSVETSLTAASERTRAVLQRMPSVQEQEVDGLIQRLAFRQGAFRFAETTALARVRAELAQDDIATALQQAGVTSPERAGLRITTSLDRQIQEAARQAVVSGLDALRGDLPSADGADGEDLNGAAIVLRRGDVLAVVGGYDDAGHDRAMVARRQPGSVAKVALFSLALRRGWAPDDLLRNGPVTVPFVPESWTPRGSGPDVSTLADALVHSRNRATAYLLAHLYDRLPSDDVGRIARDRGLSRQAGESRSQWHSRLMERGVRPSLEAQRREAALARVGSQIGQDGSADLRMSWEALGELQRWKERWAALKKAAHGRGIGQEDLAGWWVQPGSELVAFGALVPDWQPMTVQWLRDQIESTPLPRPLGAIMGPRRTLLDGSVPVARLQHVRPIEVDLPGGDDAWDPENLALDPSFRLALALEEVVRVMDEAGLDDAPSPIPSVVLGSGEVTLAEQTAMIDGLATGRSWEDLAGRAYGLVQRIEHPDGRVIWEREVLERAVLSPRLSQLQELLAGVTTYGTARGIAGTVRDGSGSPVSFAGKTGTSDGYKDASFVGVLGVSGPEPISVGVRVGFDTPSPMRSKGGGGIGGGQVAPIAAEIAQAILTPAKEPVALVSRLDGTAAPSSP